MIFTIRSIRVARIDGRESEPARVESGSEIGLVAGMAGRIAREKRRPIGRQAASGHSPATAHS